jgi:hypothetical protein
MRLLLVAALAAGCAHSTPEQREAEAQRERKCASIEIYPPGVTPPRHYKVLGPVGVETDNIAAHRDSALRDRACQLGADAVIDVQEQGLDVSGTAVSFSE